ncbi:hypothetical protein CIK06_28940 [Plantactinospora sp. KBS50]|nr:hypothetical protein CIK06_28940 [Plantactinospora sp. KBS50]
MSWHFEPPDFAEDELIFPDLAPFHVKHRGHHRATTATARPPPPPLRTAALAAWCGACGVGSTGAPAAGQPVPVEGPRPGGSARHRDQMRFETVRRPVRSGALPPSAGQPGGPATPMFHVKRRRPLERRAAAD